MTRVMLWGGVIGGLMATGLVVVLVLLGWWPFAPASGPSVLAAGGVGFSGVVIGEFLALERWG